MCISGWLSSMWLITIIAVDWPELQVQGIIAAPDSEEDWEEMTGAGMRASSKNRPRIFNSQASRPTMSSPDSRGLLLRSVTSCCPVTFCAAWDILTLASIAVIRETRKHLSNIAICPDSWLHCINSALLKPVEDSGSPSCTYHTGNKKNVKSQLARRTVIKDMRCNR